MKRVTVDIDAKLNGMDEVMEKATELIFTLDKARTIANELTSTLENLEICTLLRKD